MHLRSLIRPRGFKTFFHAEVTEHEIFSANKYENASRVFFMLCSV